MSVCILCVLSRFTSSRPKFIQVDTKSVFLQPANIRVLRSRVVQSHSVNTFLFLLLVAHLHSPYCGRRRKATCCPRWRCVNCSYAAANKRLDLVVSWFIQRRFYNCERYIAGSGGEWRVSADRVTSCFGVSCWDLSGRTRRSQKGRNSHQPEFELGTSKFTRRSANCNASSVAQVKNADFVSKLQRSICPRFVSAPEPSGAPG